MREGEAAVLGVRWVYVGGSIAIYRAAWGAYPLRVSLACQCGQALKDGKNGRQA